MPPAPSPRGRPLLAAVLAAGGLAMLAGALVAAQEDTARIPAGVTIGGLDVGGLAPDVARAALRRHVRTLARRTISITTPDHTGFDAVRISPADLHARPLIDDALDTARRSDSLRHRVMSVVGLGGGTDIPLRFALDPAAVDDVVRRVQSQLGRPPRPATVLVRPDGLRVVPGRGGVGVDEATLLSRLQTLPELIPLSVSSQPPQVSVAEAERARTQAQALLDAPPTVTASGRSVTLRAVTLRHALRFRPAAPRLQVRLDPEALGPALRATFGGLETPVREARLVPNGDTISITPERAGRALNLAPLADALVAAPGGTVPLGITTVTPERTAAALRRLRITRRVAEFTTPFACCEPRVTNIRRAVSLLDGTIIMPWQRLSLNEVLGERTLDRGFVSAPQIAGGKFEEAVGGGVSQVATTLYNAAFFAGLEIVTHTPHEFYISRYPMGREATLSWGGPELVVRNDWPAAVYVNAEAGEGSVTVRMYSAPLGRRVETVTGEVTDRVAPEVKRTVDPALAPGEEVLDMPMGGGGFTISYTRRVYRGDTVKRDERYTWTYHPENALMRVGPGGTTTGGTTTGGTTTGGTTTAPPPATPPPDGTTTDGTQRPAPPG